MISGSCLCGTVTYQVTRLENPIVFCHCSYCRKATASAFSVNSLIGPGEFHLLSGAESLVSYFSSPKKERFYCGLCHTQLYHIKDKQLTLKLGTIDECQQDLSDLPRQHIFNEEVFPWLENDGNQSMK